MAIEIKYDGHILPQDAAAKWYPPIPDPNVNYAGNALPAAGKQYVPIALDPTNQPSLVMLSTNQAAIVQNNGTAYTAPVTGAILENGVIVLPGDCKIRGTLDKIIAETTIIDGPNGQENVVVDEHIRRGPLKFDLEFTARAQTGNQWMFAQAFINSLFARIIYPASVVYILNTLLNGIGVTEIVILKVEFDTVRGNINAPMILKCKESLPGSSLIIPLNQ